jgi:hypothetical protein
MLLNAALTAAFASIGVSRVYAQRQVSSVDELRRELTSGDVITIAPAAGPPVTGRLVRIGATDIVVRADPGRDPRTPGASDVTMLLDSIRALERPRDPVGNGVAWGAGIGAGVGGALFVSALIVDRNEVDEWAGPYAAAAAAFTGIGALLGWAIDAAVSKPHLRFDIQPIHSRALGLSFAVSYSRGCSFTRSKRRGFSVCP